LYLIYFRWVQKHLTENNYNRYHRNEAEVRTDKKEIKIEFNKMRSGGGKRNLICSQQLFLENYLNFVYLQLLWHHTMWQNSKEYGTYKQKN